ncbi:DUF3224 domain-containing protein [Kitasatospora sp. NPDC002227]|uniref:DUF3224 domain-containing protein n=1 Tax=Kitasatospora sp. NPDC002227 TaxID=3154773 RepID=UPI00331A8135
MTQHTSGAFTFTDWQETALTPETDHPRLARASVINTFTGGIEAAGTTCEYSFTYVTERTGTFAGYELIAGALGGRRGSFAIEQRGTFHADGTVRCIFTVVPGSGTGELAGLSGEGEYTARHGEPSVPYTFGYAWDAPRA